MAMEDSEYGREKMTEYCRPSSISESETTCSCTDESVIDCELPEMVIFLQTSNYQAVKDMGIDKEVPSQHKCLVKKNELDRASELTKDAQNTVASISDGLNLKSSSAHGSDEEVYVRCCSKQLMGEDEGDIDARDDISIEDSTQTSINKTLLWIREVDNNYSHFQLPTCNGRSGEQKSGQIPSNVALLSNSMVLSPSRVNGNNFSTIESSFNCEAKNGSKLHEFDSSKPTISSRVKDQRIESLESSHEIKIMPSLEEGMMLECPTATSESPRVLHCRVESSSSLVGFFSGPLSCSGTISCSGSSSLRSNSSTTSTQSFAFPIIPIEWKGSPTRMAKADRRQFRKHHRWRRLLCGEF